MKAHSTYVVPKSRGYVYRCSCGAEGYVSSSAIAKQAGRDHEKKRNK
ncbi:hypothetical protein [Streptomyces sp. NPDC001315]